jgi:hypothetical protein
LGGRKKKKEGGGGGGFNDLIYPLLSLWFTPDSPGSRTAGRGVNEDFSSKLMK